MPEPSKETTQEEENLRKEKEMTAQTQPKQLEAKQGIHSILLFRLLKEASEKPATKLAFQTEHEVGKSRDVDSKKTKDGIIQSVGALEYDFKATSILAKGDELAAKLEEAMEKGELVEIWDIDSEEASKKTVPINTQRLITKDTFQASVLRKTQKKTLKLKWNLPSTVLVRKVTLH